MTDQTFQRNWIMNRDADAFAELVRRHAAMVYGACQRILRDNMAAQDVAQECFLALAKQPHVIQPSLGGWLHQVAVRGALKHLRGEQRRRTRENTYAEAALSVAEPEWNDVQPYVDEAISALPLKLREPLVEHFFEGRSYGDIAASLGIPRSTVANRVQSGIDSVRASLRRKGIVAGAALLATGLARDAVAAPAHLLHTLNSIAISGFTGKAITATVIGGLVMSKKVIMGLALVVILIVGGALTLHQQQRDTLETQAPSSVPARPATTASASHTTEANPSPGAVALAKNVDSTAPQPVPESKTDQTASISGHVTNEHGQPIADATVTLFVSVHGASRDPDAIFSATTDSAGQYSIENIDVCGFPIFYIDAEGYLQQKSYRRVPREALMPGSKTNDIDFRLQVPAEHSISGQVLSSSMEPVEGARVSLAHGPYTLEQIEQGGKGDISNLDRLSFATTDEGGYFSIGIKDEGLCDFHVVKEGHGIALFSQVMTDTTDNIFTLAPSSSISGRVLKKNGSPVPGTTVCLLPQAGIAGQESDDPGRDISEGVVTVLTDRNGHYRFDDLGPDYVYTVWPFHDPTPGGGPDTVHTEFVADMNGFSELAESVKYTTTRQVGIQLEAGQELSGVDLVLQDVARIEGQALDPHSGQPVFPLVVFLAMDGDDLNNQLMTSVDETGYYAFELMLNGNAEPAVSWMYLGFYGGQGDSEPETVSIRPGQTVKKDLPVPAPASANVHCLNSDGTPKPDARIALRRDPGEKGGKGGSLPVDANGYAYVAGLHPNKSLQLLAIFGGGVVGTSEVFSLKPGAIEDVTIKCSLNGGIKGTFLLPEGKPISSDMFEVNAIDKMGNTTEKAFGCSMPDGTFSVLSFVPAGDYKQVQFTFHFNPEVMVTVEDVTITENAITNLGTLTAEATPKN